MDEEIIEKIISLKKFSDIKNTILESYIFTSERDGDSLSILILNDTFSEKKTEFNEILFAKKLATILRDLYGMDVTIASREYETHLTLEENAIELSFTEEKGFIHTKEIDKFELIFIAPYDGILNMDIIKSLIPQANIYNTFTFGEYNDKYASRYDFNTGIGLKKEGLFFSDVSRMELASFRPTCPLSHHFTLAFIPSPSNGEEICSFFEYLGDKYSDEEHVNDDIDVLVCSWVDKHFIKHLLEKKLILKNWHVNYIDRYGRKHMLRPNSNKNVNIFTIRGDILYDDYSHKKLIHLIKNSITDILVDCDQLMMDILSIGRRKNIFFPTIKNEGLRETCSMFPNSSVNVIKTSAGNLKCLKYVPEFSRYVAQWDFRTISRQKFQAIFTFFNEIKKNKRIRKIYKIVCANTSLSAIKKEIQM